MSQVSFEAEFNGDPVTVTGGWDVQLRYYHFTMEFDAPDFDDSEGGDDGDEGLLFSNLDLPSPWQQSNTRYKAALVEFGVEAPPGFWEMIERNEGNVIVQWRADDNGKFDWRRQEW